MKAKRDARAKKLAGAAAVSAVAGALGLLAWRANRRARSGNRAVPQPARMVELDRYLGRWFELARYDNRFERGCEDVAAEYALRPDGMVEVRNDCREAGPRGRRRASRGRAKVVPHSGNAKLKVSFFGPFFVGDYWVLDHDEDYRWSIVGEPSGCYLWLLHREAHPGADVLRQLLRRAADLGYDVSRLRLTHHG